MNMTVEQKTTRQYAVNFAHLKKQKKKMYLPSLRLIGMVRCHFFSFLIFFLFAKKQTTTYSIYNTAITPLTLQ